MSTGIQWTDETWNPVSGCSKVSQGCKHCYAERVFPRPYPGRDFTDVQTHANRLEQPLRWRKPRRVFVNSMSDLFHEDVPNSFIETVFGVMALASQHTFQILTKRPARMLEWFGHSMREGWAAWAPHMDMQLPPPKSASWPGWPLPNVWLGVSVEDQETADERIPLLLQTPAAVRFISAEPLLGPVDLTRISLGTCDAEVPAQPGIRHVHFTANALKGYAKHRGLDWVIVGGESGPKARPCDVEWIRGIIHQCEHAGVPVFVKQIGAQPRGWCKFMAPEISGETFAEQRADGRDRDCDSYEAHEQAKHCEDYGERCVMLKDRKGGDPAEWPEDLRVREFPA